jgi:hypothetical protein
MSVPTPIRAWTATSPTTEPTELMTYPPLAPVPPTPMRPPGWLPDPLDDGLLRYWDGPRWTFNTTFRPSPSPAPAQPQQPPPSPAPPALRPDISVALQRVRGGLAGSMKEVLQLGNHLNPEEHVLALTGAQGDGLGVLACTNHRLLFLFAGLIRHQFLQVNWNQTKAIIYNRTTKTFAVYTTKPTKRAVPALAVRVANLTDAQTVAEAARTAAAAPRLDIT